MARLAKRIIRTILANRRFRYSSKVQGLVFILFIIVLIIYTSMIDYLNQEKREALPSLDSDYLQSSYIHLRKVLDIRKFLSNLTSANFNENLEHKIEVFATIKIHTMALVNMLCYIIESEKYMNITSVNIKMAVRRIDKIQDLGVDLSRNVFNSFTILKGLLVNYNIENKAKILQIRDLIGEKFDLTTNEQCENSDTVLQDNDDRASHSNVSNLLNGQKKADNAFYKTNTFPFSYLINEPDYCSSNQRLDIINIVETAPWDKLKRNLIREMWGSKQWLNYTGFSTIFILGQTDDKEVISSLKSESFKYKDIIQFDFYDSYDNLTLKTLSAFHWISNFCLNPTWVLKSDTDVAVNTFALRRYLDNYDKRMQYKRNQLICKKKHKNILFPCRSNCKYHKWKITYKEYPEKKYPPHCHGPGYIIPRRMVNKMFNAADKTSPFRMEDVYFTGILPLKVDHSITRDNIADKFPWRPTYWQRSFTTNDLMILELDEGLGKGSTSKFWKTVLKKEGIS